MKRATINASTFINIFKDKNEVLAMMAASLMRMDLEVFNNNITCDPLNPNNLDYIIKMPDDNTIKIVNTKTKNVRIFKLEK